MRIECSDCDAVYNIPPSEKSRKAKCKQCGGVIVVPAADVEEEPAQRRGSMRRERFDDEEEEEEKPRVPIPAMIAGGVSILLGLLFTPELISMGKDAAAEAGTEHVSTLEVRIDVAIIVVFGTFVLGFGGGGFGLFLRKGWSWWSLFFLHGFFFLFNGTLCTRLFHINWDHHRAWDVALPILRVHGILVLISLLVLGLLMLPSVRLLYGVKREARPRRRRTAGRLRGRS